MSHPGEVISLELNLGGSSQGWRDWSPASSWHQKMEKQKPTLRHRGSGAQRWTKSRAAKHLQEYFFRFYLLFCDYSKYARKDLTQWPCKYCIFSTIRILGSFCPPGYCPLDCIITVLCFPVGPTLISWSVLLSSGRDLATCQSEGWRAGSPFLKQNSHRTSLPGSVKDCVAELWTLFRQNRQPKR